MTQMPQVFLSNRVEVLYERLKEALFFTEVTPFARRLVVVPSAAMKSWLMLKLANDPSIGIATGLEIMYLDQALKTASRLLLPQLNGQPHTPLLSHLELVLALEVEMRALISDFSSLPEPQQALWKPLLDYLKVFQADSKKLSRKTERRLISLCRNLGELFLHYGNCGGRLVEEWEHGRVTDWQQALWCRIYAAPDAEKPWTYPAREFELCRQQLQESPSHTENVQIHLFALSYLSRLHDDYLSAIAQQIPLSSYLLSPCQMFWSDVHSDRESRRHQQYWKARGVRADQLLALEEYLRDRNPLLANFGRLGREMAEQIEQQNITPQEDYLLPESIMNQPQYADLVNDDLLLKENSTPLTLLEAVQADMVLLRTPQADAKIELAEDDSIQVHIAPTKLREVQIIYDRLLELIDKRRHQATPILPGDILVMAPNIAEYAPYIKSVFESDESLLTAQIMDLPKPIQSSLIHGFLHLLSLASSRWNASHFMQLFDYPEFQKCQQFSREDLHVIREWILSSGVCWGDNSAHRNELLARDYCQNGMVEESPIGTWSHACERLLYGLALSPTSKENQTHSFEMHPLEEIDATQAPLLGKWMHLMQRLRHDIKPMQNGTLCTLHEWTTYLKHLLATYFTPPHPDQKCAEDLQLLSEKIDYFAHASIKVKQLFSFDSIKEHLHTALTQQTCSHRENVLHAVRFCSLLPMRTIPSQVIVLMGMQDGVFPKYDQHFSLNLLQGSVLADYYPSSTDYDRFLFLEAILSARNCFYMTYSGSAASDSKELLPSLLVTELLAYLDESYLLSEKKPSQCLVKTHPFSAFDKSYFEANSPLKSYSKSFYAAAQAYYGIDKKIPHRFVPQFLIHSTKLSPNENISKIRLHIKELDAFAKNPIKCYFNKTLGIYLEKPEERLIKNEEHFQLTALQKYLVHKEALTQPFEWILKQAQQEGNLPIGAFKPVVIDKMKQEIEKLKENLDTLGTSTHQIFEIDCSEHYQTPKQVSPTKWQVPILQIETPNGCVKLSGKLSEVTPKGLIARIRDDQADAVKVWPQYLFFNCLIKQYALPIEPQLLFIKGAKGKARTPFFEKPADLLQHYLAYYFTSLSHISPLIPEWVPHILENNPRLLQEKMQSSLTDPFHPLYNHYVHWMIQPANMPDSQQLMDHWHGWAEGLFGALNRSWYAKNKAEG